MAERRMFAKTIVDSDAFLDMSLSTQALYFHLAMRADDDGFLNNPKKIQRVIGASEDDFRLLIAKRFVIMFNSGVIVIKHWRIHNYIQRDRYKSTVYTHERQQLSIKENSAYTEVENAVDIMYPECIQNVSKMDSQVRLELELELGKDRLVKDSVQNTDEESEKIDHKSVVDSFNLTCKRLPDVKKITDKRRKAIKSVLKVYTVEEVKKTFEMVNESAFLNGENKNNWSATFDWLMTVGNVTKVLEGNYSKGRKARYSTEPGTASVDDYNHN